MILIQCENFISHLILKKTLSILPKSLKIKELKELKTNKATGIDNLSDSLLKDGSKVFATPIVQICNLSIKLSSFPDECKIAKLKPLYKKGKKTDPKNYRPISLLPVISKILEKVISFSKISLHRFLPLISTR